jgi:hypothetical protein
MGGSGHLKVLADAVGDAHGGALCAGDLARDLVLGVAGDAGAVDFEDDVIDGLPTARGRGSGAMGWARAGAIISGGGRVDWLRVGVAHQLPGKGGRAPGDDLANENIAVIFEAHCAADSDSTRSWRRRGHRKIVGGSLRRVQV